MLILDTSVWIEYFRQNEIISPVVKNLLEQAKILALECVFGELLQGARDQRERDIICNYWINLPHCDSRGMYIEAGQYSSEHKLVSKGIGLIDCVIILSARAERATIWTLDKKILHHIEEKERFHSSP
ncbi:PIN domain-containing protein [candidate division CSSED10-310 bacterium]|uniref:PIN domain-containing protein n=1 Tax=candidate division CSSED10-310 bacterium TaxID=2855610 RepID=A0ABV6Z6E1_UNCC1